MYNLILESVDKIFRDHFVKLAGNFPSIYSADNVGRVLNDLQLDINEELSRVFDSLPASNQSDKLKDIELILNDSERFIKTEIKDIEFSDYIDNDSASFSLNYNEISVDSINTNDEDINNHIGNIVSDEFNEMLIRIKNIYNGKE